MKSLQILLACLLVCSIYSFTVERQTEITQTFATEEGISVRHTNPSGVRNDDGHINFPKVISVSPSKVHRSAIQTAYITVEVEIDADGPVWLGTGCAIVVPYKTDDPEWYKEKFAELGMDNVLVREDNGVRTSKVEVKVKDFYQDGVNVYSIGA